MTLPQEDLDTLTLIKRELDVWMGHLLSVRNCAECCTNSLNLRDLDLTTSLLYALIWGVLTSFHLVFVYVRSPHLRANLRAFFGLFSANYSLIFAGTGKSARL